MKKRGGFGGDSQQTNNIIVTLANITSPFPQ